MSFFFIIMYNYNRRVCDNMSKYSLLKDKVTLYTNVTKKTEKVFSSVKTSIKIEQVIIWKKKKEKEKNIFI